MRSAAPEEQEEPLEPLVWPGAGTALVCNGASGQELRDNSGTQAWAGWSEETTGLLGLVQTFVRHAVDCPFSICCLG